MYSYEPPHVRRQDDQHEHTFSSYVRIRDVVLKTCLGRWTIGRSGERGSGISVLPARHDDDDEDLVNYIINYVHTHTHTHTHAHTRTQTNAYTYIHRYIHIYIYIYIYIYIKASFIKDDGTLFIIFNGNTPSLLVLFLLSGSSWKRNCQVLSTILLVIIRGCVVWV